MFDWIKYRLNLNRLYAKQKKQGEKCDELRKKAGPEDVDSLYEKEGIVWNELQLAINHLISLRFCKIANKLLIPLPEHGNEKYWHRYYDGSYILTVKGVWGLKKLIRQEKKQCREGFIIWISALTGIIGATTGLVAVLFN